MHQSSTNPYGQWTEKLVSEYDLCEQIYIKDHTQLRKQLKEFIQDGLDHLQITSDFDQTITSFKYKGKRSLPSFALLRFMHVMIIYRHSEYSDEKFRQTMTGIFQTFLKIEKDAEIKYEQKHSLLQELNNKISEAFKSSGFTKPLLDKIINSSIISFRCYFEEFFLACNNYHLPIFIISGGVDYVCRTILNSIINIEKFQSIHLFANKAEFQDEKLINFNMSITSTTKCNILQSKLPNTRKNNLLFGDQISDFYMSKNQDLSNQISIGYLEKDNIQNLNEFLKLYDIVIVGDGSFLLQNIILSLIAGVKLDEDLQKKWQEGEQYKEIKKCFEF